MTEPTATFSACFGAPFMVWHPAKYAELLAEKMLGVFHVGDVGEPGSNSRLSARRDDELM